MNSPDELVQIVDAAVQDAVFRSSSWLACRPGCSQCCHGIFAISLADGARLRDGLVELAASDPARALRVRRRVLAAVQRLSAEYPGDTTSGVLDSSPAGQESFAEFGNEEPCPVLDPVGQTCDLYASRPVLCRTFGPPLRMPEGGLAVCELCFVGAPPEVVDRCQIDPAILAQEQEANFRFNRAATASAPHDEAEMPMTAVAFALLGPSKRLDARSPGQTSSVAGQSL